MAKNVVKKKQRIAHNKTCDEEHEMLFEGNDILYGIFQDMKKNNDLSAIHFTSFETNLSETSKTFSQQKIQNDKIQMSNQNHAGISKSKAFGLSRKFPLMEKCARDLKRLKHNRQMPKPRAHLSAILNSPKPKAHLGLLNSSKPKAHRIPLSNSSSFNNSVSDAKSKKTEVVGKDNKNSNNSQKRKLTEVLEHKVPDYETKMKKNFTKQPKNEEIPSKNCKSIMKKNSVEENSHLISNNFTKQPKDKEIPSKNCTSIMKKNSVEENSHLIDNNLDQTGGNSSDSDEYENFIKKVCPKKSKNKKENSKKQQKSKTKVIKKHISKPISSESDSDISDGETPAPSKTRNKNCKKLKKRNEVIDNTQSTSKKEVACKSKKVRKKSNSRAVTKYASSENDSDMNEKSSKLCYETRSKRIKRSHEVLDNRQSISKDDSESEMDIVNDGTYHDSSSESGDLPSLSDLQSNSYTCGSQSSEQTDAHIPELECNSLSPNTSVISSLVFNHFNAASSSNTSDIASAVSNDNPYISNKTSGTALSANELKPVLHNKTSDTALSVGSDQKNISYKTPVIPSLVSSAQPNASCKTSSTAPLVNNDHSNVLHKMSNVSSFVGGNKSNECLPVKNGSILNNSKEDDSSKSTVVDLTESDNECENSFSIMPKIIMTSGQIPNESELYSEESDIELLDVIVTELPEKSRTNCSSKKVRSNCSNDSTNKLIVKTEKIDQTLSCSNAKSQNTPQLQTPLNGKYEVAYSTGICKDYDEAESKDKTISQFNLSNNELKDSLVTSAVNTLISSKEVKKEPHEDCEIVFDIASTTKPNLNLPSVQTCNNVNIKAERDSKSVKEVIPIVAVKSGSFTKEQSNQSSIVSNTENSLILSKNIKKETCDDDCEIVLDIATSNFPNQKLPSVQNCNNRSVKIEKDSKVATQVTPVHIASGASITTERKSKLSQKEQKLHEVACSNFRNLNDSHNKSSELLTKEIDLDTMNIKALLHDLKKEFATYQDILHTEQSVENTFKLLERCQAEKLMSLKSKITHCLEIIPGTGDCNSIKNAVNKLLDSSELSSSSSLKDCPKVASVCHNVTSVSDISVQDLKTFATMNLVPLSSIPESDIKPNLFELKCALKQERSAPCEINSMSLGEKCVVCAKDASAACQQCAKVFFCSNICGKKYWEEGHKNTCAK